MHILLTGANGYIGMRLLPTLLESGHRVTGIVRSIPRFPSPQFQQFLDEGQLTLLEGDFLADLPPVPEDLDAAYYLLHSMGSGSEFAGREAECARRFTAWIRCRQIIYLSGLVPDGPLSEHLASREKVNELLRDGPVPVTTLRASIIVGSGSASFEIIRDLAEKLPFMITPRWTNNRCQPIAIRNVIGYLTGVLGLVAEMKMPGEAWLEFEVTDDQLIQTATFRPRGLLGRAYWYAVLPRHWILFPRMAKRLASGE